jgi:outer membrane protein assembly factor BamB
VSGAIRGVGRGAVEPLQAGDPERVGPYRLLARVGAGGMGLVYLGRSRGGRMVAVKVIRTGFVGDSQYRARFRREVAAARKVTGTFTAPVLDADPEAAEPWLVTAYLPGLTLREAIGSYGRMPPDAVRALGAGLAEALAAIHGAGVVHRDLKPGNVILTAGGPRVIDFGIARPEDGTAITQVGAPIGTPGFMSPEQVSGGEVSPASDIFTLGAVLAYAASGTEPFGDGPIRSRLYRVMTVQADLSEIGDGWLRELIGCCLHREPERRLSAAEVLERLHTADTGELSLLGTRWLPAQVAEEIDRRTAEARQLPVPREEPRGADDAVMDLATVEPPGVFASTADPGSAAAARELLGRRTVIAGIGAGVLATGALGSVLWERSRSPQRARAPGTGKASSSTPTGPPPRAVPRWKVKVSDYYPDLFHAGGVLLAKVDEENFHALDPRTGRVLWKRPAIPMSTAVGNVAYLVTPNGWNLSAVRAGSGKTLWTYDPPFGAMPAPGPAVTGSVACVGDYGKKGVRALDVRDGRMLWTANVTAEEGIAAGDGMVAAIGAKVVGLDADNGRTRWTYAVDQGRHPHFGHGLFFIADRHSTVHALRADNGKLAWRKPDAGQGFLLQVGGGMVYTDAGGGNVLALKAATGEVIWSRRLGNGEGADYGRGNALGLSGGTLYVGCTDRNVYALNAATGDVLWAYGADMTLTSGPVGIGALAFTATRDGYVHALAPPGGVPNLNGGTRAAS